MDLKQCILSPRPTWSPELIQGVVIGKDELLACNNRVVGWNANGSAVCGASCDGGNWKGGDLKACPCCRRFIQCEIQGGRSGDVANGSSCASGSIGAVFENGANNKTSSCDSEIKGINALAMGLASSFAAVSFYRGENGDADHREESHEMVCGALSTSTTESTAMSSASVASAVAIAAPPLLAGDKVRQGLEFTIKETIVQGWLHKKGTGNDIFGSRWWKPRWVTLAVSRFS